MRNGAARALNASWSIGLPSMAAWFAVFASSLTLAQTPDVLFTTRSFEQHEFGHQEVEAEVQLLDPKWVANVDQTYFLQGRISGYLRGSLAYSIPIEFENGSNRGQVRIRGFKFPDRNPYSGREIPSVSITRGPNPNSLSIARNLTNGLSNFVIGDRNPEQRWLFVWQDPPFRSSLTRQFSSFSSSQGVNPNVPALAPLISFSPVNPKTASRIPTLSFLKYFHPAVSGNKSAMFVAFRGNPDLMMLDRTSLDFGSFEDLPQCWTGLTSFGVVIIPYPDLVELMTQEPKKWDALRRRLAAGGQLVVTHFDSPFSERDRIGRELGSVAIEASDPPAWQGWQAYQGDASESPAEILEDLEEVERQIAERQALLGTSLTTRDEYQNDQVIQTLLARLEQVGKRLVSLKSGSLERATICSCRVGLGSVLLARGDPADYRESDWLALLQGMELAPRESLLKLADGPKFPSTVRGVGQAPKMLFLVLVTLFALGVGPIAMLMLKRRRRQNWILVLVPLVSLLSTGLLIAYGILSEGFRFSVSHLGTSFLDSRQGWVVVDGENAVFSSRVPEPMKFNFDTLFRVSKTDKFPNFGLSDRPAFRWETSNDWSESGGDIRTRSRFVAETLEVRPTELAFHIRAANEGGETEGLFAKNRLGMEVCLGLALWKGRIWLIEQLPAGAERVMREVSFAEANQLLKTLGQEVIENCYSEIRDVDWPSFWVEGEGNSVRKMREILMGRSELLTDREFWLFTRSNPWAPELNPGQINTYQVNLIHGNW